MSRTPEAVYETRRARKPRRCDNCPNTIAVGERYTRTALPPWKDVNNGPRWWRLHLCRSCDPEGAVVGGLSGSAGERTQKP